MKIFLGGLCWLISIMLFLSSKLATGNAFILQISLAILFAAMPLFFQFEKFYLFIGALICGALGLGAFYITQFNQLSIKDFIYMVIGITIFWAVLKHEKRLFPDDNPPFIAKVIGVLLITGAIYLMKHSKLRFLLLGLFFCIVSFGLLVSIFTNKTIKELYKQLRSTYASRP